MALQIEMHDRIDTLGASGIVCPQAAVCATPFSMRWHAMVRSAATAAGIRAISSPARRVVCSGRYAFPQDHSFGEFVFDWAWADAYQRHGLHYYPTLVASVPYTPVSGDRILLAPEIDIDTARVSAALIDAALDHARASGASSLHWLFTSERDADRLQAHGFMSRTSCQFHWHNRGYGDFDGFLATLSSRHRKDPCRTQGGTGRASACRC